MKNHGWPVSIHILLLWLFCQCGNGIGDDGGSGSNRTEGPHLAKIATTTDSTPTSLPANITFVSSPTTTKTTVETFPTSSSASTLHWTTEGKLTSKNDEDENSLGVTQAENDNVGPSHSTQPLSISTASITDAIKTTVPSPPTFPTASSQSQSSSLTPEPAPTSSSSFTTANYQPDFTTSISQKHLQQRSKLWAPHSTVADLLKGQEEDVGNNSSEAHSPTSILSPPTIPTPSNSHKSNTNLPVEKLGQQQQTRSIRSIRLIANNNSSSATGISRISYYKQDEASQQESSLEESDEEEKAKIVPSISHVNKFPVISSIRHYRSRKSFSRTRKSTNTNSGSGSRDNIVTHSENRQVPTAAANSKENVAQPKYFPQKWSYRAKAEEEAKSKDIYEMPQGDEPTRTDDEYYYGRVETRKMHGMKLNDDFHDEDRYGKVKEVRPVEEASYSRDDSFPPRSHYENSYSSSEKKDEGEASPQFREISEANSSSRKRQNNRSSRNGNNSNTQARSEDEKDSVILQRINKTFLSRNSKTRQQQRQMEVSGDSDHNSMPEYEDMLVNKESNAAEAVHPPRLLTRVEVESGRERSKSASIRLASDSKGINSYSSPVTSGAGADINTSGHQNLHWNPSNPASATFFGGKEKPRGPGNDSDYRNGESGKAHSLPTAYTSSENPSGASPGSGGKRQRNRERDRDRSGGQRQQNKEGRKQRGTRKPNDRFSGNGSGSESQANNFHTAQGQYGERESSSTKDKSSGWYLERNPNIESVARDDDSYSSNERGLVERVHQASHSHQRSQDALSTGKSNRRKEHEPLAGKRGLNEMRELKGRRDNEDGKRLSSNPTEYFPRVESFAESGDPTSGDSSNDNLFDEYRPLGHEYYGGGDSSDLLLDDDVGIDSASPLHDYDLHPHSGTSTTKNKPDSDIVTRFLNIVESQHLVGENCTAGTDFNLGEGVVDRYAQERFRLEAEFAVNRANMLTRMWKYVNVAVLENEYLLHAMVMSMVEFDDDIFAAGNCYDQYQYKNYTLFCPFAFRYDGGTVLVKDLSLEYHYLGNGSEFFLNAKRNGEGIVKAYNQFNRGYHQFRINETSMTDPIPDEVLNVTYDDGKWSKPYFDCGGANIWMITYTVPFFGYDNATKTYHFKGTSGIDIDLRRVDIDQCSLPGNSTELNIFAGSDKCKNATTMCVPISGLGFRRGSYRCVCKDGFYFPNVTSPHKYYNGTVLEEEYEKKFDSNDTSYYDIEGSFECLQCPVGCDTCEDDRPCVVSLNWLMRSAILILQCAIILMLPIVGLFTFKYSEVKVVRAASPVLLRFIVLGAFFIYCTILVMYPSPSVITCTLRVWLREIGFSLAYGALMLKTWRISVIFRVRSAKAIKITDLDLMKRLGIIVAMFTALLVIRTLVAPPAAIVSLTADDLKAWLCKTDWWDHSFTLMELSFLVWGIRLCIVVRKAPSEFNESKFISLAIYNEFLLSLFLNISMLFLQSPANPDLLYIIFFCHVQLTMTLLLCLIFGSKAYMVFRGQGKGSADESSRLPTSKFISKGRSGQGNKQLSAHNSTGLHSSTTSTGHDPNFNSRLSEDVQEEFRRLYAQLEELKERNMRLGNRHLVAKIAAMQEAADNILQAPSSQINGQSVMQQQLHQLSPGSNSGGNNSGGNGFPSSSSSGGGGHSPHKGKSPSAFGPLSDIQEENPLQSLSKSQVQSPVGPKVLETSIDIVIQSDSPSRKTAQELGDNEHENNLNNGLEHPLAQREESTTTSEEGITRNKDTDASSCQLTRNSSSELSACDKARKEESVSQNPPSSSTTVSFKEEKGSAEVKPRGSEEPASSTTSSKKTVNKQDNPKSVSIEDNSQVQQQNRNKKSTSSPSASPVKQQGSKSSKSEKHHHPKQSVSTCQKSSGGGTSSEGKAVNHKDAPAGSGGKSSSQKIILDLDDKSRFTEEITV